MSMDWQRANRNARGRARINIPGIENVREGSESGWQTRGRYGEKTGNWKYWERQRGRAFNIDADWFDPDFGAYDAETGLLEGYKTGRFYYIGQWTREDLEAVTSGFWGPQDFFGYDLGTTDFNEAVRMLATQQGRFNERTAEISQTRSRNEDRQVSNIQAQIRALQDYNQAQSLAHSQQMTDMQKRFAKQVEDYNMNIESAFRSVTDLITSLQAGADSPSTIQTLYLDRQAKTYLPSSIRNRGIAGVMGGQV